MADDTEELLLDLYHPALDLIARANTLKAAQQAMAETREAIQAECKHPIVFRCEWGESPYAGARADGPHLQCAHCLTEESEWNARSGVPFYQKALIRPVRNPDRKFLTISRETMMGRRLG